MGLPRVGHDIAKVTAKRSHRFGLCPLKTGHAPDRFVDLGSLGCALPVRLLDRALALASSCVTESTVTKGLCGFKLGDNRFRWLCGVLHHPLDVCLSILFGCIHEVGKLFKIYVC